MARPVAGLYARVRHLIPELAKFGVVGAVGAVIDLGGAAVLHGTYHLGPLTAKALSIGAATVVTYLGSRFWTFRHRENQPLLRETMLFLALNVVGLIIAEAVIACTTYAFGFKGDLAYNMASVAGTGLATIFRYFAYRKWVFLAPAAQPVPHPAPQPMPQPAPQPVPAGVGSAGFAPWEAQPWEPQSWEAPPEPSHSAQPIHQLPTHQLPTHQSGQVRLRGRHRKHR